MSCPLYMHELEIDTNQVFLPENAHYFSRTKYSTSIIIVRCTHKDVQ